MATNSFLLAKYHPDARITGVDCDSDIVARNLSLLRRTRIRNLAFVELDVRNPAELEEQDVVVMSDVIANRPADDEVLKGAVKLVRPGGYLVIHTSVRQAKEVIGPSEPRKYSENELRELLQSAGVDTIFWRKTFGRFGSLAWRVHEKSLVLGRNFVVMFFPPCLLLALLDTFWPNSQGHGALVIGKVT